MECDKCEDKCKCIKCTVTLEYDGNWMEVPIHIFNCGRWICMCMICLDKWQEKMYESHKREIEIEKQISDGTFISRRCPPKLNLLNSLPEKSEKC